MPAVSSNTAKAFTTPTPAWPNGATATPINRPTDSTNRSTKRCSIYQRTSLKPKPSRSTPPASPPAHIHLLVSFQEPKCTCPWRGATDVNPPAQTKRYHPKTCPAWQKAHALATRYKRVAGGRLSRQTDQPGRKWFSRGEDISPIHDRQHFAHHLHTYLPRHKREGGTIRIFDPPTC